jgi:hypothetical protein
MSSYATVYLAMAVPSALPRLIISIFGQLPILLLKLVLANGVARCLHTLKPHFQIVSVRANEISH